MEFLSYQLELIADAPYLFATLFGLIAGSFLNVVIHRLPQTLYDLTPEADTPNDENTGAKTNPQNPTDDLLTEPKSDSPGLFTLISPRSQCPHCARAIAWYDNIPVLSFLWLKGRCRQCLEPISWRYPIVEIIAALACIACVYRFGANSSALIWWVFCLWLIAIAAIDFEHMLIPDALSLSGMWLGLLLSCTTFVDLEAHESIIGAAIGYLLLYTFYWLYFLLTRKAGLGFGDFKLMAMLGAWMGYGALVSIVFYASIAGSVYGLMLHWRRGQSQPFAFGPWLSLSAIAIVFLPELGQIFMILN